MDFLSALTVAAREVGPAGEKVRKLLKKIEKFFFRDLSPGAAGNAGKDV